MCLKDEEKPVPWPGGRRSSLRPGEERKVPHPTYSSTLVSITSFLMDPGCAANLGPEA